MGKESGKLSAIKSLKEKNWDFPKLFKQYLRDTFPKGKLEFKFFSSCNEVSTFTMS